jgi:hypothetical protein
MPTLNDFFLPSEAEVARRLARALSDGTIGATVGGVAGPSALAWRMLPRVVAGHLGQLLDIGIGDILVGAWNKSHALRQNLSKSAQAPGKETFLELAEHKVTSKHKPYVALLRNGQEVARLPFSVDVEITLQGAVLKILDGAIREIQTGQMKGKGSVKCGGALLVERQLQPLKLPVTMPVGRREEARVEVGENPEDLPLRQ